jgi:hypothetical protein
LEAETKAKALAEAEEEARAKAEAQAKIEAELVAKATAKAKAATDALAKADAEARERAESQAKLEAVAKAKALAEAEEEARAKAEAQAKIEAELEAKAIAAAMVEAEKKEKADAKLKAKAIARAEMIAKAEAIEKARLEAESIEKAEAEAKAVAQAKALAEEEDRRNAELRAIQDAEAQERAEEEARNKAAAKAEAFAKARVIAQAKADDKARKIALRKKAVDNFKTKTSIRLQNFTKVSEKKLHQAINLKKLKKAHKQWQSSFFQYLKKLFLYSSVLIVLIIAAAQFFNLSMFVVPIEYIISSNINEPITIGSVHASLFPKPHITLQNVSFGDKTTVIAKNILIYPELSALIERIKNQNNSLNDLYEIDSLNIEGLIIEQKYLQLPNLWLKNINQHNQLKIKQITLNQSALKLNNLDLPAMNGFIELNTEGVLKNATFSTQENDLTIDIENLNNNYRLNLKGTKWRLPLSPNLVFSELTANGFFENNKLTMQQINGYLYDGKLSGNMIVDFASEWQTKGDFILSGLNLNNMSDDIKINSVLEGNLTTNSNFSFIYENSTNTIHSVIANIRFKINDGMIKKVDLIEAMRSNNIGGSTHFDELSGSLSLENNNYVFKNLTLQDKQLQAYGSVNINADKSVTAEIYSKIPLKSNPIKSHLILSGTIDNLTLKK